MDAPGHIGTSDQPRSGLARRTFLQVLLGSGSAAMAGVLAGCGGAAAITAGTTSATGTPFAPSAVASAASPASSSAMAVSGTVSTMPPGSATSAPRLSAAGSATASTTAATSKATSPTVAGRRDALKLTLGSEPETIDPAKASFWFETEVVTRVFSNLLMFDGQGNLVPELAAALPRVSADGRTYTFTLKDGLQYSDGAPLRARDFEYAWKRHLDPALAGEYAFTGYAITGAQAYHSADPEQLSPADLQRLRDAVGVKATDDHTLVFALTAPSPWFLSVLATWCGVPTRQDMVEQGGARWTEPATYIGNGPYVLKTWDHRRQMIFEANPRYYRGVPPITTVQYLIISEPAVAFAAYQNGDLDAFSIAQPFVKAIAADPTLAGQVVSGAGTACWYMGFNTRKAPFDNGKVRQAFSLAIDRARFVQDILGDIGIAAHQFIPEKLPGHYGDLADSYQRYDPRRAKQVLADAGFPDGQGLPAIRWSFSQNDVFQTRVEALAGYLKDTLGVPIALDPVEPKAYTALLKKPETTPQLFLTGWTQDYPDPQDWYSTVFQSTATANHTGWKNGQFDTLCQQADHEVDPAKRAALYAQAAQLLNDEAPAGFLWFTANKTLVKPALTGYQADPTEFFFGQHRLFSMRYQSPA